MRIQRMKEKKNIHISQEIDFLCFFGTITGGHVGKSVLV